MHNLLIASFVWAFSFGLIKTNLSSLDTSFVAFVRLMCALPVFLPFLKYRDLSRKQIVSLIGIGAIQYGLMYLFVMKSFNYLQAYQVVLFTTFTPLYVVLVGGLVERTLDKRFVLAAILAFLGSAALVYQETNFVQLFQGFLLVQCSDLCFAFGQVAYKAFMKRCPKIKDREVYAFLFLGAGSVTLIATLLSGGFASLKIIETKQLLTLAYLGIVASGICFYLWNKGAVIVNVGILAVMNNLKIPLGVLVSLFIFGESADYLRLSICISFLCLGVWISQNALYPRQIKNLEKRAG